jgi:transcription initiation factor IIE alpha subunit
MINQENSITCPACSTKIPFDVKMLLSGMKFSCPNSKCDASIGLSQESAPLVEQTLEKLEALKIK